MSELHSDLIKDSAPSYVQSLEDIWQVSDLIKDNKDAIKYFNLKYFEGYQIWHLLDDSLYLITKFKPYLDKLTGDKICSLMICHKSLHNYLEPYFDKLSEFDKRDIILKHNEYIDIFILTDINAIVSLIISKPEFITKYEWVLDEPHSYLKYILNKIPDKIDIFNKYLSKLSNDDIYSLVIEHIQLLDKLNIKGICTRQVGYIITRYPNLIDRFKDRLIELDILDVRYILIKNIELLDYFKYQLENVDNFDKHNVIKIALANPDKIQQLKPYLEPEFKLLKEYKDDNWWDEYSLRCKKRRDVILYTLYHFIDIECKYYGEADLLADFMDEFYDEE